MRHILDLDRYPLDQPGTSQWTALVERCQEDLRHVGMYNLDGFVRPSALSQAIAELRPVINTLSFTHRRKHNIYFRKEIPELPQEHPALAVCETVNHTVCADQITQSIPLWIYEWAPFAMFLAATMGKDALFQARDPLARVNVMTYRAGEQLNWHFDRSEFTTTLLLQEPQAGGEFIYRNNLRSDADPNFDGVARLLRGEDDQVRTLALSAGTLNVFRGKNTAHRVSPVIGDQERIIAVFAYFDRPGVVFSREDQLGFYGRTT